MNSSAARDIVKLKNIGVCMDEQGATNVENLWKGATNHEGLRTTAISAQYAVCFVGL